MSKLTETFPSTFASNTGAGPIPEEPAPPMRESHQPPMSRPLLRLPYRTENGQFACCTAIHDNVGFTPLVRVTVYVTVVCLLSVKATSPVTGSASVAETVTGLPDCEPPVQETFWLYTPALPMPPRPA